MKPKSALRNFLALAGSSILAISSASAITLYWDGTTSTANADGGAGAWNGANLWDTAAIAGANATWTNSPADSAVFGGTAGAVTTGAAITTGGIQFNTTGYTITADATNTLSFSGTSNILFNNVAAATITGTVGGAGNVVLSATNPVTAGTLTLNGTSAGGWSGTTTINPGMTLALAGSNRALFNTTGGITLNGGGITLTNVNGTEGALDRVNNSAITSNGGTITYANSSVAAGVYAETIGSVALTTGQLNIVQNTTMANGLQAQNNQTLTLGGLTQAGTSAITFSALTTGPQAAVNRNMIVVSGAGTTAGWTDAAVSNSIHGPWATVGTAANAQTDYAVFSGGYVIGANTAASLQGTWTDSTKQFTNNTASVALSGNRTMNALRNTAATATITLSDGATGYTLATNGILNGVGTLLTIAPGTVAGSLTAPGASGGNIYLNAGSGAITVSAPINNNGGNVTVVKNGSGTLTLSSVTSNYSGGTVINAGSVALAADTNLGATSGGLTFNGTGNITYADGLALNANRTVTFNAGANVSLANAITVNGILTGSGAFNVTTADGFWFKNASNDFQGTITVGTAGSTGYGLEMASIGDLAGAGLINLGITTNAGTFRWAKTTGGTTTFSNRQFALSGTTGTQVISAIGTSAAENLIITKDLLVTGVGNKTLSLAGTNLGDNTFSGKITDGTDGGTSIISVNKVEAGKWILSGANTYTGGTTVGAGTLQAGAANVLGTGTVTVTGGTLQLGAFSQTTGNVIITGGTIDGSTNALTASRYLISSGVINPALVGSGDLNKFGTGTFTLNGTSNTFTGGITVGGGTLAVGASSALGQNVVGNSILIRDGGILTLAAAANSGNNQAITLSSSSKSGGPVSTTAGGAGPTGRLAVLGLGFNGLPTGAISQANTNGGVIAINGVTGYNTSLASTLGGSNMFLGAIGTSTFTGAAGTVGVGAGSLYRLGGGGGQITFNTTNLFTSTNGVQVGSTFLNGGGTVVISEAQDYSGATTVSQGTLTLSGANGAATGSSGFTLNGGRLFLDSVGTGNNNANRIGNVGVTLSNGGDLHLSGNASGTTEAFGNLGIGAGYSFVTATAVTAASSLSATGFTRTDNGTALFRGTALGQNTTVMGQVTLGSTAGLSFVGASTLAGAANGDTTKDVRIIPYLIGANTPGGTGDTFVTYDTTLGFRALSTTQFNTTATAGTNVRLSSAQAGIGSMSINSLIIANSGSSTIADGATLTVASGAVLFSVNGTIAPVTAGSSTSILAFGTAPGIITTANTTGIISARITGSGGLIKSGTSTLTLSNSNNSFSGGIVLNAGTLTATLDSHLGDASNTITLNGNATMGTGNVSYARSIILNNGSILLINNETPTFTGNVTGTGGLAVGIGAGFSAQAVFSGTANTFEGPVLIGGNGSGNANYRMTFASLADSSTANGRIVFSGNSVNGTIGSRFEYTGGTGGNTSLLLNNRQIELASTTAGPTAGHQIMNSSVGSGTLTIATDLIVSTPIEQALNLRGTNTGANTFSGVIGNGDGKTSLIKNDAGRWILSNANTFTGTTLVSGGTLELGNSLALQNSALDATNSINGTASAGLKTTVTTLTIGELNGTKNLRTLFTSALGGTGGATAQGGYDGLTALTLNPGAGQTTSYSGSIVNGASGMTLTKAGAGTQILSSTNTYTGATTVNNGKLVVNGNISTSVLTTVQTGATLGGSGTVGALTIDSGGIFAPGNSPGIETVNGTYIQNGTLQVEIESDIAGNGTGFHDQVVVNGTVTLNGLLDLMTFTGTYAADDLIFILLNDSNDAITGTFTGLAQGASVGSYAGFDWQISYTGNSAGPAFTGGNDIALMAVIPEPRAALLGGLGMLLLLRRRRN